MKTRKTKEELQQFVNEYSSKVRDILYRTAAGHKPTYEERKLTNIWGKRKRTIERMNAQ